MRFTWIIFSTALVLSSTAIAAADDEEAPTTKGDLGESCVTSDDCNRLPCNAGACGHSLDTRTIETTNPGLRTAGYVLLGVGGAAMSVGLVIGAYGLFAGVSNAFACVLPGGVPSCSNDTSGYTITGGVLIATGATLLIMGVVFAAVGGHHVNRTISHVAPSPGGLALKF